MFKLLNEHRSTTELHEVVHTLAERAFDGLRKVSPDGLCSNWLPGSYSEFKWGHWQRSSVGNRYQVRAFRYANRTKDICNGHQDWIR